MLPDQFSGNTECRPWTWFGCPHPSPSRTAEPVGCVIRIGELLDGDRINNVTVELLTARVTTLILAGENE